MMKNTMGGNTMHGRGMGNSSNIMSHQGREGGRGDTKKGPEEFTIEEYQASLQEFLSHDEEIMAPKRPGINKVRESSGMTQTTQRASNSSHKYNDTIGCYEVPTNLGDKDRNYDVSFKSLDTLDLPITRNTFKSVDSSDRPSFRSLDDLDIRPSFRSVDTMDLMSLGNSIHDIMEEDLKQNPEMRKKYSRRLSASSRFSRSGANNNSSLSDFAHFPGTTLEVKTMSHGQGGGGGPKKIKKAKDPRLSNVSGARELFMQQEKEGKSGTRGSLLSLMSKDFADLDNVLDDGTRMSFGNM